MPLQPPPDHSWTYRILALGTAFALFTLTLTRDTSRHVGDPSHSLPFGGYYRDGSKVVHYNSPRATRPTSNTTLWALLPITLILVIHALHRLNHRDHSCRCNHCISTSQT
ncbi:P3 [Citrus yellow mottle-associated virus]|uniref:P3 n=1 Tax=Citrus yellow mottle-associated virus TaxID=2843960 RepID=A0A650F245_9VIRU|nr:P3 [Citrus yellow mottle virus]QGT76800.1 P3 [Citrus yellow mottle virus]WVH45223.1 12.4 kDa triple gene block protein [Citrus yellow mottle-associated virus]